MSDELDGLTKAAGGGGLVAVLAGFLAWLRSDRTAEREERVREKAEEAHAKRHADLLAVQREHTAAVVEAMREQSKAQLAGIEAAARAQGEAFASAGGARMEALTATVSALASGLTEMKQDMRELRGFVTAVAARASES